MPDGGDLAAGRRCARSAGGCDGAFTLVAVHGDDPDVGGRRAPQLPAGGRASATARTSSASDVAAFIAHTATRSSSARTRSSSCARDGVTVTGFDGAPAEVREYHVDWDASAAEKGGYDYFMLKEIAEQPQAVADTLLGRIGGDGRLRLDEMRLSDDELRDVDKVVIVACGTAYHAGLIAKYAIEHWTPDSRARSSWPASSATATRSSPAHAGHRDLPVRRDDGHADGACGTPASSAPGCSRSATSTARTIPRESDAVLYTHAGPEVAVASTKAFLTQLVACYLVALYLAQVRGTKCGDEIGADAATAGADAGRRWSRCWRRWSRCAQLARELADERCVLFLGRHVGYPVALEGALKLKELAYMHAEGFAAGELKHGPIALIEEGLPVVVIVPSPRGRSVLHDKIVSNIQEIRARGARTIVIAEEGDEAVVPYADT